MLLKVKTIFIFVHGLEDFLNFSNFRKVSLEDARAYYLSIAKNELGVVSATSDAGNSSLSTWFIIYWNLGLWFRVFHYNIGFPGLWFRVVHCKWLLGFYSLGLSTLNGSSVCCTLLSLSSTLFQPTELPFPNDMIFV